jgi:acyl carrier protein
MTTPSTPTSVEETVIGILADVLGESPDGLHNETILTAHGWDSLASLEALAQLENRLNIALDLRSFHAARTVGDMVELVGMAVLRRQHPATE